MSSFTEPLTVTKISGKMWRVERGFEFYVGSEDSGARISVPEGFETDFASVPRIFWTILPPDGEYTQAAVLHDYLYNTKKFSRKYSDDIFLMAMEALGVALWKRNIMYRAVRMFGWRPWSRK